MTKLPDIDAIRARAAAATPGPWRQGWWSTTCSLDHFPHGEGKCSYDSHTFYPDSEQVAGPPGNTLIGHNDYGPILSKEDAAFIAHAPADIAQLCDEVDRLRTSNANLRRDLDTKHKQYCEIQNEVIRLRMEDDCPTILMLSEEDR